MTRKSNQPVQRRSSAPTHAQLSDDDINAFQAQREKISLEDDKDQEYDEDGFDQAVMDLPSDSDSDADDYNDSDHDADSDQDDSWGRNKKTFYSADVSAEDLDDEAREARKLQKKQLSALDTDDFGVSAIQTDGKRRKSGPVTLELSSSEEESESIESEFKDRFATEHEVANVTVEEIQAMLPDSDKIRIAVPEVRQFFAEFERRIVEVQTQVQPVLAKLRVAGQGTEDGLSFLSAKKQILVGYCANLAFYLLMRVEGRSGLDKHPVVTRLVKYRLLIEKIKPMEAKLQYQIDKLLQAAVADNLTDKNDQNELAFRPNLDMLMDADENGPASSEEESDSSAKAGIYKAPKLAPMHFEDKRTKKTDKLAEREKMLASTSRLLADMQADLEDKPEEDLIDPVYGRTKKMASIKDREAYEEENFVRFTLSKKEQRRLDQMQAKPIDELEDLNDFFKESRQEHSKQGKNPIEKLLGMKRVKAGKGVSGDDDLPARAKHTTKPARKNAVKEEIASDMSEIEDDLGHGHEDEFYRTTKQKTMANKAPRQERPVTYRPISDQKRGQARPASYEMIKNKGLTPNRPKEMRNPRVRQRQRWERAQKKIKSFKAVASDSNKAYGGEASGIRTNITKSVKFN